MCMVKEKRLIKQIKQSKQEIFQHRQKILKIADKITNIGNKQFCVFRLFRNRLYGGKYIELLSSLKDKEEQVKEMKKELKKLKREN